MNFDEMELKINCKLSETFEDPRQLIQGSSQTAFNLVSSLRVRA